MKNRAASIIYCAALTVVLSLTVAFAVMLGDNSPATLSSEYLLNATNTYEVASIDKSDPEHLKITYDLSQKYNVPVMTTTQITVLTHGLGGTAGDWSNQYNGGKDAPKFAYDETSIINRLSARAGGANIYWAKMLLICE